MAILILGLVLVLGIHSLKIVMPTWQADLAARIGEGLYKGLYSLVSSVGLVLIVWGFARAWQSSGISLHAASLGPPCRHGPHVAGIDFGLYQHISHWPDQASR